MDPFVALGAVFWTAIVIFGIILGIAWLIVPFALIGTKPLLRDLLAETRRTNDLLQTRRAGVPMEAESTALPAALTPDECESRLRSRGWVVESPKMVWKLISPDGETSLVAGSPEALAKMTREILTKGSATA